jgi:hypothetical protein
MRSDVKTSAAALVGLMIFCGASAQGETSTGTPPTASAARQQFYVEDIKAAMMAHLAERVDAGGVFRLRDDKTGEMLALRFVEIHDPVRQIDGDTYFACTDFHALDEPDKLYDVDFWMNPRDGQLRIYDTKVHKEPRRSLLYGWYKQPRYTFVNDRVVSLYSP